MKNSTLRLLIILGLITIIGNFGIQLYLLRVAYNEEQNKFSQTVHIALLEVIKKIYGHDSSNMPQLSPVKRVSNDYYIVDINDHIYAKVLEFYLIREFERFGISTDFEYAIYDCATDRMVYGNYIDMDAKGDKPVHGYFPKYPDLVYYFGVRFPDKSSYLIGSLKMWLCFLMISVIILVFFVYAILAVLRQKRYSEMQRDFINNMTHEFKTPLTSSRIALEYIMNTAIVKNNDKLNKYCEMISGQNDHLNNLIERILQISYTERRNFILHKKETDLLILCEKIVKTCSHQSSRIINLNKQCNEAIIMADEVHLTNILYSLLDNAIKYSNASASIEISIEKLEHDMKLSIQDQGIGISKEFQKHIFKKFYRIPTGDVHNVKGFGLGLFYVKKVCDRHRWKISISSIPGHGTTIVIHIPI